jgi:hypothetical protein
MPIYDDDESETGAGVAVVRPTPASDMFSFGILLLQVCSFSESDFGNPYAIE